MAFGRKYYFRFDSANGVEHRIYISKDGYSGDIIQRKLGRDPILKKQQNGPICGTSLELYVECAIDGEFAELYTSNPKEFKVEVLRSTSPNSFATIWTGFVSPELYSEPSIAPPYDVQIIATDGLGELKLNNYAAQGEVSLRVLLSYLLSFTGSDRGFYFATNLRQTGGTPADMLSWAINLDFLDGKTCYEVLTQLLDSLHATITTYINRWLIARETDIEDLLNSYNYLSVISYINGQTSTSTLRCTQTLGQRGVAIFWPNGYLSTAIAPAKKSLVVKAPWHLQMGLKDPEMEDATSANWDLGANTFHISDFPSFHTDNGYFVGDRMNTGQSHLTQSFAIPGGLKFGLQLKVKVQPYTSSAGLIENYYGRIQVYVIQALNTGAGTEYFYGTNKGWSLNMSDVEDIDLGFAQIFNAYPRPKVTEISLSLPALGSAASYNNGGNLYVVINGRNTYAFEATLDFVREEGYKDTLYIDNQARGEAAEVEILGGRVLQDNLGNQDFYQGIWKYSGSAIYSFVDSAGSGIDFLSIQALGRAVSVALARVKTEGIMNIPSDQTNLPLIVKQGSQLSWVETWEWNLRKDDVKISALSTPNASITVESEVVEPIDNASTSGGGSSSGGSSGGSSSGDGTTLIKVWRSLTNNDDLEDYGATTEIAPAHLAALFTEVSTNPGKYLKLNTAYSGLASDGFITAGASAASSDRRLKDDIMPVSAKRALAILMQLHPKEWRWNEQNAHLFGKRGAGLVAQEVAAVLPLAVVGDGRFLALNYNVFHAYEIAVAQVHEARIRALEEKVEALTNEIERLKGNGA